MMIGGASRVVVSEMHNGSVLRIEPTRAGRDDAMYTCTARNGIGEPANSSARLQVYARGSSK